MPIEVKILHPRLIGEMKKTSFLDQGIAKVDRLQQEASNAECSAFEGKALPEARTRAIEAASLATVKMPVARRHGFQLTASDRDASRMALPADECRAKRERTCVHPALACSRRLAAKSEHAKTKQRTAQ